jgi:hypothetical protein
MATFVVGDFRAGAIGHLIIGLVLGPVLGAVGDVIGKTLARGDAKPATVASTPFLARDPPA